MSQPTERRRLRPPKRPDDPTPPMRPGVQRAADIGIWGGLVALAATIGGFVLKGPEIGIPALGAFLCFLALWIGSERGLAVLHSGVIVQRVKGSLKPVVLEGGKARFQGWLNLAGSVVLMVLGGLVLVVGVGGQLG